MSTLQSLMAVVGLILAICVIVQAIQELLKSLLQAKPKAMMRALEQFMGEKLKATDVQDALKARGLDITALETFSPDDFRHLLDAIPFAQPQLQGIVASAAATEGQIKDNIAAAFQGAMATFQKIYTKKNKIIALILSMVVVLILNANILFLYETVSADPIAQQTILNNVKSLCDQNQNSPCGNDKDIAAAYSKAHKTISGALNNEPALIRTPQYSSDFENPLKCVLGLLLMGAFVSLGTPFWNDVLKGATGLNNSLNGAAKKS